MRLFKIKILWATVIIITATIKSEKFNNLNKIEQHKLVYKSLKGKMGMSYTLSITTEGK